MGRGHTHTHTHTHARAHAHTHTHTLSHFGNILVSLSQIEDEKHSTLLKVSHSGHRKGAGTGKGRGEVNTPPLPQSLRSWQVVFDFLVRLLPQTRTSTGSGAAHTDTPTTETRERLALKSTVNCTFVSGPFAWDWVKFVCPVLCNPARIDTDVTHSPGQTLLCPDLYSRTERRVLSVDEAREDWGIVIVSERDAHARSGRQTKAMNLSVCLRVPLQTGEKAY